MDFFSFFSDRFSLIFLFLTDFAFARSVVSILILIAVPSFGSEIARRSGKATGSTH